MRDFKANASKIYTRPVIIRGDSDIFDGSTRGATILARTESRATWGVSNFGTAGGEDLDMAYLKFLTAEKLQSKKMNENIDGGIDAMFINVRSSIEIIECSCDGTGSGKSSLSS